MFSDLKYELTRGFAYRRIEHEHQSVYTTLVPLILAIAVTTVYIITPEKIALLGKDGSLTALLSIVATLPGFYFAGLAAVSTFGSTAMDTDMTEPAPKLEIRYKGILRKTTLSRRKYMSYLFSYLVILSFVLCGVIMALNFAEPTIGNISNFMTGWKWGWRIVAGAEFLTVFSIALLTASIAVTTLQGLFFLSERIHQP